MKHKLIYFYLMHFFNFVAFLNDSADVYAIFEILLYNLKVSFRHNTLILCIWFSQIEQIFFYIGHKAYESLKKTKFFV